MENANLVPKSAAEVTTEWLAAVMTREADENGKAVKAVEVIDLEGEKDQSGLLSCVFR